MQITELKCSDLIGAEYNPRKLNDKQRNELRDSLNRFGFVDPVLVNINKDRKNIIIGGHQRKSVWEEMGNTTIPCIELDLTLDQEKELNVRLNKSGGDFDMEMLEEHFDTDLLVDWGFESYQFEEPEEVDLDEFFEEQTPDEEPKEETKKIILEYKEEDYDLVVKAFSDLGGTKEDTVFKFLGL
mgnify:CR=1 FL=1